MHAHGSTIARALAIALVALGAALLAGCATSREPLVLDVPPTTGALAVDVENFRGTVEIRVDRRTEGVSVKSSISGPEETMDAVHITADLEESDSRAVLRVRSTTDHSDPQAHSARLLITAPRVDGVRVVNRDGEVIIVRAAGAVEVANTGGAVEFRTDRPVIDPVTITTVDGNIYYQVPPGSTGMFDLKTLDGRVSFKNRDGTTDGSWGGGPGLTTRLNEGMNPIVARTNAGNIIVRVDEDAVEVVRAFRVVPPDPRDHIFLNSSRRYTRNLPDDHPEVYVPTRQSARYLDEQ